MVPPNYTDKLQPIDLSVQKSAKGISCKKKNKQTKTISCYTKLILDQHKFFGDYSSEATAVLRFFQM